MRLPIRFSKPSEDIFLEVARLLPQLPIVSRNELVQSRIIKEWEREAVEGRLATLLPSLTHAVDADYRQLVAKAADAPYCFEFLLDEYKIPCGDTALQGLVIHTRLYRPGSGEGSIFYGSWLFRVGNDRYLYWLVD